MREFRYTLDPSEGFDEHAARWDKEVLELQAAGYAISGRGPDGDYPVREFFEDPADPLGRIVQVFEVMPL